MIVRTIGVAIAILVLSVILVQWLLNPSTPELPTFAQVEQKLPDRAELARAHREGRLIEDPVRGDLRRAVLLAHERLEQMPCDEGLRRDLVAAAIPFIEAVHKSRGAPPIETYHGERGVLNATEYLDYQVIQNLSWAAGFGWINHEELPDYAPDVVGPFLSQFKHGLELMGRALPQPSCQGFPGHPK